MRGAEPVVVDVDSGADIIVHDTQASISYGGMLASLDAPDFPGPLGVLWKHERPSYEQAVAAQVTTAKERRPDAGDLQAMLTAGQTWEVK